MIRKKILILIVIVVFLCSAHSYSQQVRSRRITAIPRLQYYAAYSRYPMRAFRPSNQLVQREIYIERVLIKEYPSSINNGYITQNRSRTSPISYASNNSSNPLYVDHRISEIEERQDRLENSIYGIQKTLNEIKNSGAMSDEKYRRLLQVEQEMRNTKGILVELKEYLKTVR